MHYLSLLKLVDFFLFKLGVVECDRFPECLAVATLSMGIKLIGIFPCADSFSVTSSKMY